MYTSILALLLAAVPALAVITPTTPDSATVVKVGEELQTLWTTDSTGQWTNTTIQLMTGDNFQMVPLAVLATGIDGTSATEFSTPCPDVTPYSKIYFLQFTAGGDPSTATWTTRFTISGANGEVTEPTNSTTTNGQTVEWGTGALVGSAPEPVTGGGSSSNSTTDASTGSSAIASASASPSASATEVSDAAASSASSRSSPSSTSSQGASRTAASAAASSTGAAVRSSQVGLGAIVLGLAGWIAL